MPGLQADRIHKILKTHLDRLYEEYETVVNQLGSTLDDGQGLRLQRQLDALEQRIKGVEKKIRLHEISASGQAGNRRYLHWENYIPYLDFTEAVRTVQEIIDQFERTNGGAALFLLQNAHSSGGRWCIERVRRLLSERTADFKHYEVGLSPGDCLDAWTLLSGLGEYVGCEPPPIDQNVERDKVVIRQYAEAVGHKIMGSLQSGSIVFVELRTWDHLSFQTQFLPWFVRDFWRLLVGQLPTVTRKYPLVSFVGALVVLPPISEDCLTPDLCCTEEQFDGEKILQLPLPLWTKDEIRKWLLRFSGLTAPHVGVKASAIERMAQNIYDASQNGKPDLVYTALMRTLEHYFDTLQEEPV